MKSSLWYVMFPQDAMAISCRWGNITEREFRKEAREFFGVKSLKGAQVWRG